MVDVLRGPLVTRITRLPQSQGHISEGIVLNPPNNAVPFHQTEWPNVRAYPVPRETRNYTYSTLLNLPPGVAAAAGFPLNQYDWPNRPHWKLQRNAVDWVFSTNPMLLKGPDIPLPFVQQDWPNWRPIQLRQRGDYEQPSIVLTQANIPFVATALPPGLNRDWPNPRSRRPQVLAIEGQWNSLVLNLPPPKAGGAGRVFQRQGKRYFIELENGARVFGTQAQLERILDAQRAAAAYPPPVAVQTRELDAAPAPAPIEVSLPAMRALIRNDDGDEEEVILALLLDS